MLYLEGSGSESGPAAALLRLVDRDALSLFINNEILEEVCEVLSRPQIHKRNPDLTDERVAAGAQRRSSDILLLRYPEDAPMGGNKKPPSPGVFWILQQLLTGIRTRS